MLQIERQEQILELLAATPALRIGEIADAFGFHDEFHLSNAFKKKFGMSPQKYRQLHTEITE
jgi:AraC-like DNA-binding protein